MSLNAQSMIEQFVAESLRHLADAENDLVVIRKSGANGDPGRVDKVFRAVHSIKGAAGFLGLTMINDLTQGQEDVLNLMRSGDLDPTVPVIDNLLQSLDPLRGLLNEVLPSYEQDALSFIDNAKQIIRREASPEVVASIERRVKVGRSATAMFDVSEHLLLTHRRLGNQLFVLDFDLIRDVEGKGKSPLSLIKELLSIGEVVEARLDHSCWGGLESEVPDQVRFVALVGTAVDAERLMAEFGLAADHVHALPLEGHVARITPSDTLPATSASVQTESDQPAPFRNPMAVLATGSAQPEARKTPKASVEPSIRVSAGLLDHVMNLADELVVLRNQLVQMISARDTGLCANCRRTITSATDVTQHQLADESLAEPRPGLEQTSSLVSVDPDQALVRIRAAQRRFHALLANVRARARK